MCGYTILDHALHKEGIHRPSTGTSSSCNPFLRTTYGFFLVAPLPVFSYNSIVPSAHGGSLAKNVTYDHFFSFFGMREDPFHVSPDPRFYCRTRSHESALAELLFGIETRQGFMVLTGEAGTGKTTLLHKLLD